MESFKLRKQHVINYDDWNLSHVISWSMEPIERLTLRNHFRVFDLHTCVLDVIENVLNSFLKLEILKFDYWDSKNSLSGLLLRKSNYF